LLGCACPSRCTSKRSTSFFTSASITRRTTLRSDDHKCSTHLLRSPEDGILGLCQIKCHRAIFHHHGVSRPDEKVFDCSDQSFRVHIKILAGEYLFVCDE